MKCLLNVFHLFYYLNKIVLLRTQVLSCKLGNVKNIRLMKVCCRQYFVPKLSCFLCKHDSFLDGNRMFLNFCDVLADLFVQIFVMFLSYSYWNRIPMVNNFLFLIKGEGVVFWDFQLFQLSKSILLYPIFQYLLGYSSSTQFIITSIFSVPLPKFVVFFFGSTNENIIME